MNKMDLEQFLLSTYGPACIFEVEQDPSSDRFTIGVISDTFHEGKRYDNAENLYRNLHRRFGEDVLRVTIAMALHPLDHQKLLGVTADG